MSDIAERLRQHVMSRGGPAKDDAGNYIGTTWPMMLEGADHIELLRERILILKEALRLTRRTLVDEINHINAELGTDDHS